MGFSPLFLQVNLPPLTRFNSSSVNSIQFSLVVVIVLPSCEITEILRTGVSWGLLADEYYF